MSNLYIIVTIRNPTPETDWFVEKKCKDKTGRHRTKRRQADLVCASTQRFVYMKYCIINYSSLALLEGIIMNKIHLIDFLIHLLSSICKIRKQNGGGGDNLYE